MSAAATEHSAHGSHGGGHGGGHDHGDEAAHIKHYNKVFVALIVLFFISVMGPEVGAMVDSKALVLVTAFGIALVKAYLVCAHFMHLNVEKKYIIYLLTVALTFIFLFYAGVAPDIMEHHGRNWENVAARDWSEKEQAKIKARAGQAHGEHAAPQGETGAAHEAH